MQAKVGFYLQSLNYPGDAIPGDLTLEKTRLGRHAGDPSPRALCTEDLALADAGRSEHVLQNKSSSLLQPWPDPFVTLDYFPHTCTGRQHRQLQGFPACSVVA